MVTRRILMLRGVNVGGTGRLPMADFRAGLAEIGFANPRTLIASGNATFDDPGTEDPAPRIAAMLRDRFNLTPALWLGTPESLAALLARNPFATEAQADGARVHAFLTLGPATDPDPAAVAKLATTERLSLQPGACWLHTPDGLGRSKLAERLPKLLGCPTTARNHNTLTALLALAQS